MKRMSLLFLLLFALIAPWAAQAQVELTVYEGTASNNVIPAYIYYFDDFTRSQYVIPADDLAEMNGGTINSVKFYTTSSNVPYTSVSTVDVYLMEVDYTTMTALEPKANGTIVYQGTLNVVTEGEGGSLTIEFSTPYTYGGGNLLVGIENTTDAGYKNIYFYGQSVTGASWGGSNYSSLENVTGSQRNFIPKTTFAYTAGATDCEMPTAIAVSDITADGATVTWEGNGDTWNLRYKTSADADYTMVNDLTETTYTLTGLNGNTTYSVGVQTVCTSSTSFFKSTSFTTDNPCLAPTNLQTTDITDASATLSWTAGYPTQSSWIVTYKKSADAWDDAKTENVTSPTITLTELEENTTYNVRIYACADGAYLSGNFTTKYACAAPTNLVYSNITTESATVSWTPGYEETQWTFMYWKVTETPDTITEVVNNPTISLVDLDEDSQYQVRVYNCMDVNPLSGSFYTAEACPDGLVCIGSGKTTSGYLPTYTYYNYSLTQQIYTAAEIGGAGAIMSIDFYSTATERTRNLDIYMVNTDQASFAAITDYIAVTSNDLVYSGNVTFAQNAWTTIALNNPFAYADDTKNLAIIVHDKTGGYVSSPNFLVFEATDMALYAYNDNYDYVPSTPGTYSNGTYNFTKGAVKNRIRLLMGEITDCDMPTNLAVSNITMESADLTWTAGGSETAWQVCINGDEDNLIDVTNNAYQMTNLTAATTYTVKVRANCGSGQSYWTPEISFNTAICDVADQCQISYEFSVNSTSYTTWHSATIDIVDVETNLVLATLTYDAAAPTGTVTVCDGRTIKFVYNPATPDFYNAYNVYSFTDVNNEEIFSGSGTFETVNYNVDCTIRNCDKPAGLAVASLVATWEAGEATAWNLQYKKTADTEWTAVNGLEAATYTFADLDFGTEYEVQVQADCGTDGTSSWTASVTFTTPLCAAEDMCEISIEMTDSYGDGWNGNAIQVVDTRTETVLATWTISSGSSATATLAVCDGREIQFVWVAGSYANETSWVIYDRNGEAINSGAGSSSMATGDVIDAYAVDCTVNTCVTPTDLVAVANSPETATVEWTSDHNNFQMQYRPNTSPNNDFETSSMKKWTTIDADGDGYDWVLGSQAGGIYLVEGGSLAGTGHNSSNDLVTSGSYSNATGAAITPDNYLVSPLVELGGSITFWACAQDASYCEEHFAVVVSTTSNTDPTAFTILQEWTITSESGDEKGVGARTKLGTTRSGNRAQSTWQEYTVDLRAYAGETGYVAIRHFDCTDQFMLNVDDIVIVQPNYVEPEWIVVNDIEASPYTLEDLEDGTEYEVQLRGVCGEDSYTAWATTVFETPSFCDAPTGLEATNVEATTATLNWTGYTDTYNVRYRTAAYQTAYFEDDFDETHGASWTQIDGYTNYYWSGTSDYFVMMGYDGSGEIGYAITPELSGEYEEGSFVYFEYRTIPADSLRIFKVGYSSTTADLEAFTWGEEVTTTANQWRYFYELIPAGTKYVAIQHTDEYEGVAFVFDNFGVYAPAVEAGEWVELNDETSPLDITGLNPETLYEWQVQGANCDGEGGTSEWSASDYFETIESTTPTQTFNLTAGWNWISTYIDMNEVDGLRMLEEKLGDYGISIVTSEGVADYFGDGYWDGLEDYMWANSDMIIVQVNDDCTVTLEGPVVDPSTVEVTINPGWNYIGFPFDTEMAIADAFSPDFEPEFGDGIASQDGLAEYMGEWDGVFDTLLPGHGYMYQSWSTDVKTLLYNNTAKIRHAFPTKVISKKKTFELRAIETDLIK